MTIKNGMMLWTDAYLADTGHLTTIEHGAYLLILMAMWRSPDGRLPNDDVRLCRSAHLTMDKWRRIAPTIQNLLTVDGNFVTQKRLLQEREIATCKKEKRIAAGVAGNAAKSLKTNKPDPALRANPEPNALAPNPAPLESKKEKKVSKKDPAPDRRCDWPDDFGDQFWNAFPKLRRHDKPKVFAKLERLRAEGFVDPYKKHQQLTWAVLMDGVARYVASCPGDFAKAPLAWLNGQRWAEDFSNRGGSNGAQSGTRAEKPDVYAVAAANRFGGGNRNGAAPAAAAAVQPAGRIIDQPAGSGAGVRPPQTFDSGLEH